MSRQRRERRHEAQCNQCGRCCYLCAVLEDGSKQRTILPCKYLDLLTNECMVYPERFKWQPRCLTIPQAIESGILPSDCPYVAGMDWYVGPTELVVVGVADA